jgi:hypothetical protein
MRRSLKLLATALLLSIWAGCTPEGVGDPCEPESCPPSETEPGTCDWQYEEVYLEHFSLQCRTRVCMVFRYEETLHEPYCTRRCGPSAAYVKCPGGYACAEVSTSATPGAGCYCVDKDQLNLQIGTSSDLDKVDACK